MSYIIQKRRSEAYIPLLKVKHELSILIYKAILSDFISIPTLSYFLYKRVFTKRTKFSKVRISCLITGQYKTVNNVRFRF